jgi:hypothetical protein
MNRIETAVTAAVENEAVEAGSAIAPIATVVAVSVSVGVTVTDATVTGGCYHVAGSTQKPVLECMRYVGDVEGMSAGDLLRIRRAAL